MQYLEFPLALLFLGLCGWLITKAVTGPGARRHELNRVARDRDAVLDENATLHNMIDEIKLIASENLDIDRPTGMKVLHVITEGETNIIKQRKRN